MPVILCGRLQLQMERPDTSSSDEEDDRHNLIEQNDRKLPNPNRSTFHIDDDVGIERSNHHEFRSRIGRRFGSLNSLNKRYMFAIFLPLLIVVLYFSVDFRNLFSTNLSGVHFDSFSDRLRESELRALYLLRKQQLGLFSLWNHTFPGSSSSSNNSSLETQKNLYIEDLKFAVLRQISLNKEIQQVLLSPHRVGNSSSVGSESDSGDPSLGRFGLNMCGKVDQKFSERKTIEWKPNSNKYLFAICLSGQMSNHLICLEKHMFFAALLNRVLVIPSPKFDYSYSRVLDIDHINNCLGRKVVVTFDEFAEAKKNNVHINKFICYFSLPRPCYVDDEHIKKLKGLGISMGKLESAWVEDVKKPSKRTVEDFKSKFSTNDDVLAIGDVFFADVEKDWVMQPGGPLAHKCNTLVEPSRLIILTAQRFIQTFLGKNFVALHFRRHGFLKFWYAFAFPVPLVFTKVVILFEPCLRY